MFGPDIERIFLKLPDLKDLSDIEARRTLSTLYLDLFTLRIEADREMGPSAIECANYVRRLANALESYAIFDSETPHKIRFASAFVAAEGLALLVEPKIDFDNLDVEYRLAHPDIFTLIEAALLYLIAGFDANAFVVLNKLPKSFDKEINRLDAYFAERTIESIFLLCGQNRALRANKEFPVEELEQDVISTVRGLLFKEISEDILRYLNWRRGVDQDGLDDSVHNLAKKISILEGKPHGHCDIQHLVKLLLITIEVTSSRALIKVPPPNTDSAEFFSSYLISRCKGEGTGHPRPLLWPSAMTFVKDCMPGPRSNAVVTVPTGSGKSFIAELALSHAIANGWTLYLVPTNALANQVRIDLERAFSEYDGAEVRAFFGGEEYTKLETDEITSLGNGVIAVMTPEKCALALRLSPAIFGNCRLCVFDECHLLVDGSRGVLAELVISHLITLNSSCRFVLMSALVANAKELATWLTEATGNDTKVIDEPWRPTRTMRGIVALDHQSTLSTAKQALEELSVLIEKNKKRKKNKFHAPQVLVCNLQGAWKTDNIKEYAMVRLPTHSTLEIDAKGIVSADGWVNSTASELTSYFGNKGLSVLTFLPGSKHYPFSVGKRILLDQKTIESLTPLNSTILSLLDIAEDELGTISELSLLLRKGVSVHTAALLDSEKQASELAFQKGCARVMTATGTLAQGLNLPASVAIIAGTAIGDQREASKPEGIMRSRSQLLNALGRAGRAFVANHGIGLVVTQNPVFAEKTLKPQVLADQAEFLKLEENSTIVLSQLEGFVSSVLSEQLDIQNAKEEDLVAFSYLPLEAQHGVSSANILRNSFAFHKRKAESRQEESIKAAETLAKLGAEFISSTNSPIWISNVAYKTGLPFVLCLQLLNARIQTLKNIPISNYSLSTYEGWLSFLIEVMQRLHPEQAKYLLGPELKNSKIVSLWKEVDDGQSWKPLEQWIEDWHLVEKILRGYMQGEKIADLSKLLLSSDSLIDFERNDGRKPIPKTLKFLKVITENLSRASGALACIEDEISKDLFNTEISELQLNEQEQKALQSLPLAVKNGFNNFSGLQWYRFGVRFRRPAHVLGRLFPIPHELYRDEDSQRFVRRTLGNWLNVNQPSENLSSAEQALLEATKRVILNK